MVNGKQAISLMEQTAKYVQACGKRSILERKPQTFEKINLSGLKLAPIGDTFVAKTPKYTSKITELPIGRGRARLADGTPVGSYVSGIYAPSFKVANPSYPESWFDATTGKAKSSLHIIVCRVQIFAPF